MRGYLSGGVPVTDGYGYVVSIGLKGALHCSGTYIGKHTVLTAAHCIYGYNDNINAGDFDVRFGSDFLSPTTKVKVASAAFASGGSAAYNPKTYEDDIGVMIFDGEVNQASATLIPSPADWNDILAQHYPLFIVGFGFNYIDGGHVNAGIKREAQVIVSGPTLALNNRKITLQNEHTNTCDGDSGGPTFIEKSDSLLLAAVTSEGDDTCSVGVSTRVDAYTDWISTNVK